MSLRINDLLRAPQLCTRLVSGGAGCDNVIGWAHVCELADPAKWLSARDLLMTIGIGIPLDYQAQFEYVQRLSDAGLAGIVIGENPHAPTELSGVFDSSERFGFPVLMTAYGVPFTAIAKAIAQEGQHRDFERRQRMARIYESARANLLGLALPQLLERLEQDVDASLWVVDSMTVEPWVKGLPSLPLSCQPSVARLPPRPHCGTDTVHKVRVVDDTFWVAGIPEHDDCILVCRTSSPCDYLVLQHIVAVLGLEISRLHVAHERRMKVGRELLEGLLRQELTASRLEEALEALAMRLDNAVLAVTRLEHASLALFHSTVRRQVVPVASVTIGEELLLLLNLDHACKIQTCLGSALGVSGIIHTPGRAAEALRESRLALAHTDGERPIVSYGLISGGSPWLPQSVESATRTYQQVLGKVCAYDEQQGRVLLHTLNVFLSNNRSWLKSAKLLHIHKQTLVYRIKKIEELTGRSLSDTEDVSVLWLALKASSMCGSEWPA
ncbi:PucR family transcriptional regulator [Pseudomonas capeferrum]|uniref:PucR family transcriptional regulator n=1 Tax=Pseudomonas capeferrum TaxID=1495066 RepID=UPI0015E3CCF6|nr:PucR family transcriptional regulator [Pseudomonas capeferrum]MBA1201407.1 PucR family transcriptional regulator [Pseudomonas capeferrum]